MQAKRKVSMECLSDQPFLHLTSLVNLDKAKVAAAQWRQLRLKTGEVR
jgi:hypothetical protein